MEALVAQGVADGRRIYVAQRAVCCDKLFHRTSCAYTCSGSCGIQPVLGAVYTAYISDYVPCRAAAYEPYDERRAAVFQKELNVVFWFSVLYLLRSDTPVADAGSVGNVLEVYVGHENDSG